MSKLLFLTSMARLVGRSSTVSSAISSGKSAMQKRLRRRGGGSQLRSRMTLSFPNSALSARDMLVKDENERESSKEISPQNIGRQRGVKSSKSPRSGSLQLLALHETDKFYVWGIWNGWSLYYRMSTFRFNQITLIIDRPRRHHHPHLLHPRHCLSSNSFPLLHRPTP